MLENELHFLLLRCFHLSNRQIVQKISALGLLPGQPKILEALWETDGRTAKEIGELCAIDKSTMTSLLAKMEKQDLIQREQHTEDRRANRIFLTPAGRDMAARVKEICHSVDETVLSSLSSEEREELLRSLQKLSTLY